VNRRRAARLRRPLRTWARGLALEGRLAVGPPTLLVGVALGLVAGMRLGPLGGATGFRVDFVENLEAFVPLAVALGAAFPPLVEPDHQVVELAAPLPVERLMAWRLALGQAVAWLAIAAGALVMAVLWGPVPLGPALWAALGPGLFLSGLAAASSLVSGRVAVGLLLPIGLAVADLVLRVLGAFAAFWPLQLLDLFAYRWNVTALPWPWVKAAMAAAGLLLLAYTAATARHHWVRHL
jgi:hypothetical protein